MQISRNTITGEIVKGSLGNFFRTGDWVNCLDSEGNIKPEEQSYIDNYELKEAKELKTKELKTNRDNSLKNPITTIQAEEITLDDSYQELFTGNNFYFSFRVDSSGIPSTEPNSLINDLTSSTDINYYIRYSCLILDGEGRKGYVKLTKTVAENIKAHIKQRAETNIAHANKLEDEINNCSTITDINNIDITF